MTALRKILGALSCSVLLCVGLGIPDVASSAETKKSESEPVIIGKLLRIEGNQYIVRNREDGKEVRLYVDKTTTQLNPGGVTAGDNVMARVDDQNHIEIIWRPRKGESP